MPATAEVLGWDVMPKVRAFRTRCMENMMQATSSIAEELCEEFYREVSAVVSSTTEAHQKYISETEAKIANLISETEAKVASAQQEHQKYVSETEAKIARLISETETKVASAKQEQHTAAAKSQFDIAQQRKQLAKEEFENLTKQAELLDQKRQALQQQRFFRSVPRNFLDDMHAVLEARKQECGITIEKAELKLHDLNQQHGIFSHDLNQTPTEEELARQAAMKQKAEEERKKAEEESQRQEAAKKQKAEEERKKAEEERQRQEELLLQKRREEQAERERIRKQKLEEITRVLQSDEYEYMCIFGWAPDQQYDMQLLKATYHRLSRMCHPDHNLGSDIGLATLAFQRIERANTELKKTPAERITREHVEQIFNPPRPVVMASTKLSEADGGPTKMHIVKILDPDDKKFHIVYMDPDKYAEEGYYNFTTRDGENFPGCHILTEDGRRAWMRKVDGERYVLWPGSGSMPGRRMWFGGWFVGVPSQDTRYNETRHSRFYMEHFSGATRGSLRHVAIGS